MGGYTVNNIDMRQLDERTVKAFPLAYGTYYRWRCIRCTKAEPSPSERDKMLLPLLRTWGPQRPVEITTKVDVPVEV